MKKPNILMILTDQQSCWTLGAYGGTLVQTPHIDRIAAEGARLDNYFTNSAVCTPSRGCLLTGRYPHCHGAFLNDVPLGADEVTIGHILRERGVHLAPRDQGDQDDDGCKNEFGFHGLLFPPGAIHMTCVAVCLNGLRHLFVSDPVLLDFTLF